MLVAHVQVFLRRHRRLWATKLWKFYDILLQFFKAQLPFYNPAQHQRDARVNPESHEYRLCGMCSASAHWAT